MKAEQNAEYSRQSETRFREEKAAEQRRAKEQEKARKEKQQAEVAVQKAAAETKPAPKPAPVLPNQLQLHKYKIHVVKKYVQINHVIIVA